MSPEADKHSPRIDDLLAHEVEGLVRGAPDEGRDEGRLQQASGPGEPGLALPDRALPSDDGSRLDEAALDRRARLAAALAPAHFPADATALADVAAAENLGPNLLDPLRALAGESGSFATVQEVWMALGGDTEPPHAHPTPT